MHIYLCQFSRPQLVITLGHMWTPHFIFNPVKVIDFNMYSINKFSNIPWVLFQEYPWAALSFSANRTTKNEAMFFSNEEHNLMVVLPDGRFMKFYFEFI